MPIVNLMSSYITDETNEVNVPNPALGFPCAILISAHVAGIAPFNTLAVAELRHADTQDGEYESAGDAGLELTVGASRYSVIYFGSGDLKQWINPRSFSNGDAQGGFDVWIIY